MRNLRKLLLPMLGASVLAFGLGGTAGALTVNPSPCPLGAVTCIPEPIVSEDGDGGSHGPSKLICTPEPDGTVRCSTGKKEPLEG